MPPTLYAIVLFDESHALANAAARGSRKSEKSEHITEKEFTHKRKSKDKKRMNDR